MERMIRTAELGAVVDDRMPSHGDNLLHALDTINGRLERLSERLCEQLRSVRSERPVNVEKHPVPPDQPAPPLFSEARERCQRIDRTISWLNEILDEIEL